MSRPMTDARNGRRPRRQFDDDFKAQAVRLVLDDGKTVAAVARDLDLTESAVREWVKRAQADRTQGRTGLTTAEREELARLRKEVRELRTEREILKNSRVRRSGPLLDEKLPRGYAPQTWEQWPSAYWCRHEPVKKHGPRVACALDSGDAAGRSRLGK